MKKIIVVGLMIVLFLTGCSLFTSTPRGEVQKFLNKYKNNDKVVVDELNNYLENQELSEDSIKKYREIYLRQYSNLKYEIKDEKIDGDNASVEVLITVYDYYKANQNSLDYFTSNQGNFLTDDGDVDFTKYIIYKLNKLLDTNDTVNYTLILNLTKMEDGWQVDPLTTEQLTKIHGTYEY